MPKDGPGLRLRSQLRAECWLAAAHRGPMIMGNSSDARIFDGCSQPDLQGRRYYEGPVWPWIA
jgi:hypothetical protein